MTSWGEWITASLSAWVIKGAVALGFGIMSMAGFDVMKENLDTAVANAVSSMAADLYSIMSLAGFIDAIGIWLGAVATVVALSVLKRFTFLGMASG